MSEDQTFCDPIKVRKFCANIFWFYSSHDLLKISPLLPIRQNLVVMAPRPPLVMILFAKKLKVAIAPILPTRLP